MIAIVGESASGKTTIEKVLVEKYGIEKIVTYTTRSPRVGEKNGIDYFFIDEAQYNAMKLQGFFAETASYNGWSYGTAKKDCTDNKVIVVTPHGLRQLQKIPDIRVISFYIEVPRKDRLIQALKRKDDIEEAYRRNLSDVGQFDGIIDEIDYVINNHGYIHSAEEMADRLMKLYCPKDSNE